MKLTPSASQTVGPFFRIGLEHLYAHGPAAAENAEIINVSGKVLDGDGDPVPDAILEIWHADAHGAFAAETDSAGRPMCFTRTATDDEGRFQFCIPRPGTENNGMHLRQAPHISVLVFARGLLRHLVTRMYFADEAENASDPLLRTIPEDRRHTLIAKKNSGDGRGFEWNVVLQGPDETVFFAW